MSFEDLAAERAAVVDAINGLQLTRAWAFEYTPASPNRADSTYLDAARESDLFVLIVSNSHSSAVQDEIAAAESRQVPILAFVREVDSPTEDRQQVVRWLRDRVKYGRFKDVADLRQLVVDSLATELVRGYRRFRLADSDVATLVEKASAPPSLIVRTAERREADAVRDVLRELRSWYPEIEPWIERVVIETNPQTDEIRIAEIAGQLAGVAVARDKEPGVRKFSTIYVRPGFRGESVGPHLVYEEVKRASRDGVRKAFVTFADELHSSLFPILSRYGFVSEGVSASRYRAGAAEWVMSKAFVYGSLRPGELIDFVENHMVQAVGGRSRRVNDHLLVADMPTHGHLMPRATDQIWVVLSESPTPEDEYRVAERRFRGRRWLFVSLYGRPAEVAHWSHGTPNWIDGADLMTRFYPLDIELDDDIGVICPIRPEFAEALIPFSLQQPLLAPDRLQIRPDNVYYRTPDRFGGIRRGARIHFWVTAPTKALRGTARITELSVDRPEACISRYGTMGILSYEAFQTIAAKHSGRVLAIAFDWYEEAGAGLDFQGVKEAVAAFNPVTMTRISAEESRRLSGSPRRL